MSRRPYQDRNILSNTELANRLVVLGPLGLAGYHPNTNMLYFLINAEDKYRFFQAAQGQSLEKIPVFPLKRVGGLGTLDAFWQAPMAKTVAAAIQFIPYPDKTLITHMVVRPSWRQLGINSRLVDYLQQSFQKPAIFENLTDAGQKFVDSYRNI